MVGPAERVVEPIGVAAEFDLAPVRMGEPLPAPLTRLPPSLLPLMPPRVCAPAGFLEAQRQKGAEVNTPAMATLDELIDAITETWMAATSDAPSDADPDALAEHRQLCRNEVEVFLGVLRVQPEAIRAELARLLLEAEQGS